jgi:mRNA interferase MazF
VRRGDLFWAELAPRSGSEQTGRRPVVIVSHDAFNEAPGWRSLIVVPVSTSATQAQRGPTAVPLVAGAGGLRRAGVALCHQVTTLDRAKLTQRLGTLRQDALARIEDGLKAALDLE